MNKMELYNEYLLVEVEEDKSVLKTADNKGWKKVKNLKDNKDLIISPISMLHYKDNQYFIQERHVIAEL